MNAEINRLPSRLRSAVKGFELAFQNLMEQLEDVGQALDSGQMTAAELAELRQVIPGPPGQRLIPLPRWEKHHPWPTTAALYHLVAEADANGFHGVFQRQGRRIFIDEAAFAEWQRARCQGEKPEPVKPIPRKRRGRKSTRRDA